MIFLGISVLVVSSALAAYVTTCFFGTFFVFVGYFVLTGVPFAIVFPPPGRLPEGLGAVFLVIDVALPAGVALIGWTLGVCAGWRKRRV